MKRKDRIGLRLNLIGNALFASEGGKAYGESATSQWLVEELGDIREVGCVHLDFSFPKIREFLSNIILYESD